MLVSAYSTHFLQSRVTPSSQLPTTQYSGSNARKAKTVTVIGMVISVTQAQPGDYVNKS